MKKYIILAVFAVVFSFLGGVSIVYAQTTPMKITVLSPNGGEVLSEGQTHTIKWTASSNIDSVNIMLKASASSGDWIANSIPNTGSFNWVVQKYGFNTSNFTIEITGYDVGVGSVKDSSDAPFSITPAPAPIISSVIYSPGSNGVSETFTVSGQNFLSGSKLNYIDTQNTSKTANMTYIFSFSPTKIKFGGDLYTANMPGTFKLKIIDPQGNISNEVTVDTRTATAPTLTTSTITSIGVKDSYTLGNNMYISWTPTLPGVSTIFLVPLDGHVPSYGIYGMKVYGNPVNTTGNLTYQLPKFTSSMKPGKYYAKLIPADGSPDAISRVFTIKDKVIPTPVFKISSFYPTSGPAGSSVTIYGTDFLRGELGFDFIDSNGKTYSAALSSANDTSAAIILPSSISGDVYSIRARHPGGVSTVATGTFTVTTPTSTTPPTATQQTITLPAPTPTPQMMFTRNMWRGLRGNDVKKLQEFLNSYSNFRISESGLGSPGQETTYYGFLTQVAVQNFQCQNDIACSGSPDTNGYGVVGPKTRVKMQEVSGGSGTLSTTPPPTAIPTSTPIPATSATTASALQQEIQQMLKQLQLIQNQLKALQGAMVLGVFGKF